MKKTYLLIPLIATLLGLTSCDKDLEQDNDVETNFECLWSTIDQKYCFFGYKKDSIMDWNEAHDLYLEKAKECKTMEELFYVFGDMLNELKDGHVNLTSTFDISRYDLQGDYEDNFIKNTIFSSNYLGKDYRHAGGFYYKMLEPDSIGYIYYPSFSVGFTTDNINNVLYYFRNSKGLILDIRGNGGGQVTNADALARHFTTGKIVAGYYQRKTGAAHYALSDPEEITLSPSSGLKYIGPVVLLTNRDVYSAANKFTQQMRVLENVLVMGDKTGGGSGMPSSDELPCGWTIRYSSAILLDANKQCMEWGIEPDVYVSLDKQKAVMEDIDTIIEEARKELRTMNDER